MQQAQIMKLTPDQAVITSWTAEARRLRQIQDEIMTKLDPLERLIELYTPARPASQATTKTIKTTTAPTTRPTQGPPRARTARSQAGIATRQVMSCIPSGEPGVTQKDLQTRLPRVRHNVIGRIVEAASAKGTLVRDASRDEIRYWRPTVQSSSTIAAE